MDALPDPDSQTSPSTFIHDTSHLNDELEVRIYDGPVHHLPRLTSL